MSPVTPPFHDLEFSRDVPLWPQGGTEARRVFLMPTVDASLFVAFGASGASGEVRFVARGSIVENLEPFIKRMTREEALVELYIQPPVPKDLLDTYGVPPPYEGHEFENPPKPPVNGVASSQVRRYSAEDSASPWDLTERPPRRAFLVPLREPTTFLALGCPESLDKVLFALEGSVQADLPRLLEHLRQANCRVELFASPPLPRNMLDVYLLPPVS